jgi:hypothetical protein
VDTRFDLTRRTVDETLRLLLRAKGVEQTLLPALLQDIDSINLQLMYISQDVLLKFAKKHQPAFKAAGILLFYVWIQGGYNGGATGDAHWFEFADVEKVGRKYRPQGEYRGRTTALGELSREMQRL